MSQARAIIFEGPGRAVMRSAEVVEPTGEDVRIEAKVSLVSAGTERSLLLEAPTYPIFPGYSMVGTIAAIGDRVRRFKPGDRVVAGASHGSHPVIHESFVSHIPEGVSDEHAAFFNIGTMALHCVRLAEITFGDPVLIIGQGLIGLMTTQIVSQAGALPVIGVDIDRDKLERARSMGADHVFHTNEDRQALEELLHLQPGGGAAAAIELAGSAGAIDMAVELTRRQGRVVAAGLVREGHSVDIYGRAFVQGLKLIGGYINAKPLQLHAIDTIWPINWPVESFDAGPYDGNGIATTAGDVQLFLRLAALGRLKLDAMLDEEVSADDAVAMFDALPTSRSLGRLIRWR